MNGLSTLISLLFQEQYDQGLHDLLRPICPHTCILNFAVMKMKVSFSTHLGSPGLGYLYAIFDVRSVYDRLNFIL